MMRNLQHLLASCIQTVEVNCEPEPSVYFACVLDTSICVHWILLLVQLLQSMTAHMVEARSRLHRGNTMFADTSQLLLIVSDGRCLGDRRKVQAAVRRAQDAQIFLVFIVLANPDKEVCCTCTAIPFSAHHLFLCQFQFFLQLDYVYM